MRALNPIIQATTIKNEFKEYLISNFQIKDQEFYQLFLNELKNSDIFKGPYISMGLPFKKGKTLQKLIDEGFIDPLFKRLSDLSLDRTLYKHQEEAFTQISSGQNVVITTGTGSGKTEAFLYPILNRIIELNKNGAKKGIKAIMLYPMNALVNDQFDRLRKLLKSYPSIKYAFYTGDTKEEYSDNLKNSIENDYNTGVSDAEKITIPPNELISRDKIRDELPDILFTNFSMMEYLLLRPKDSILFNKENMENFKFFVLDEAHTYRGALAIEISMLLKRFVATVQKTPQFILTSATLGVDKTSTPDIIKFASDLTNVSFKDHNIIFSVREKLDKSNCIYTINPNSYPKLLSAFDEPEKLYNETNLLNLDKKIAKQESKEMIYDLLISDKNIFVLSELLFKTPTFDELYNSMKHYGFNNVEEVFSLIQLISLSQKGDKSIFDSKFHTFVRTLDGAYVTLGKQKKLKLSKHKYIDDLKAFELGQCKFCNETFIIGRSYNGLLMSNEDIDLYENYDENDIGDVEFYNYKELKDYDGDEWIPYNLCIKCGKITEREQFISKNCDCGPEYKIQILKANKEKSTIKNNLYHCPHCGKDNRSGVIQAFNLGKDSSTALLGQILYKTLDKGQEIEVKRGSIFNKHESTTKKYKKRYLAFSDSRSQASYFAIFMQEKSDSFLRKKIIYQTLKDKGTLSVRELASLLQSLISEKSLFNTDKPAMHAWVAVLYEMLMVDGNNSGEGLGMYSYGIEPEPDIDMFLESDDFELLNSKLTQKMSKQDFYNLLNYVLDNFRGKSTLDYSISGLTDEEKEDYLQHKAYNNYILLNKDKNTYDVDSKYIVTLISKNKSGNTLSRYIQKTLNPLNINEFLGFIFEVLKEFKFLKPASDYSSLYKINIEKYKVRFKDDVSWYKCQKCNVITTKNINNICVKDGCEGKLFNINPDDLKTNYYRKEYIEKLVEPFLVKEHTAQLDKKDAKKYQIEFTQGKINVLSSSTTFEMGVSIDELETVFMRNVPPSPANYVQRAGRAGRTKNAAAFILTYANKTSHDYSFFQDPKKMINGIVKPPIFKNDNETITLRHLLASALSVYFKNFPDDYKNIESFVLNGGTERFINFLKSKPKDLGSFIDNNLLSEFLKPRLENFKWLENILKNDPILRMTTQLKTTISDYETAIKDDDIGSKTKFFYKDQIKLIKESDVVSKLAYYGVIPKYGFATDVVDLRLNQVTNDKEYQTARDLSMAISEYAPDSEINVDGNKFTSRYIIRERKNLGLPKNYYTECDRCEKINISNVKELDKNCSSCGNPIKFNENHFLIPKYGFASDFETKNSKFLKPKRTYSNEIQYLGNGELSKELFLDFGSFNLRTSKDDELLLLNTNPFYSCQVCGYTVIDKESNDRFKEVEHRKLDHKKCESETLDKTALGHILKTDALIITFIKQLDKANSLSILYALLEGMSFAFEIERKDLNGTITKERATENTQIIIYDAVPGGAGHVKRLINKDGFKKALDSAYLKVNLDCCDENTSCSNCLQNYYNQSYHGKINRKMAKEGIDEMLKSIDIIKW